MKLSKRWALILVVVLLLILRYGKWEILSYQHAFEFYQPILSDLEKGCLVEPAKYIKVLEYSDGESKVFVKGRSGTTWLITFNKIDGMWTQRKEIENTIICHNEIINTTMGGSADGVFWYW